MSDVLTLAAAFALAAAVTLALTPLAIALALRTDFLDHPAGYKQHERATPYLGGIAVIVGFAISAVAFANEVPALVTLLPCALALLVVPLPAGESWR